MTDVNTADLLVNFDGQKWVSASSAPYTGDITTFVVKQSVDGYPTTVMIPLRIGGLMDESTLQIRNSSDTPIPAQFKVITRWGQRDNSIRHVEAVFIGDGSSYTIAIGENPEPSVPAETGFYNIGGFTLRSEYVNESDELELSFARPDKIESVEESGPIRWTGVVEAPALYHNPNYVQHGYKMRIQKFAGSPIVKVAFQLKNDALRNSAGGLQKYSSPMFFKSHKLVLPDLTGSSAIRADTPPTTNVSAMPFGVVDTANMRVQTRYFQEKFPHGLKADAVDGISVELWPEWASQNIYDGFIGSSIYWLDDMRCHVEEVTFDTSGTIAPLTVQFPPIGMIDFAHHKSERASIDLHGLMGNKDVADKDTFPAYWTASSYGSGTSYQLGKDGFRMDTGRRYDTATTGGIAYSSNSVFMSGNPGTYYESETFAMSDINIRPVWLSGFNYDTDFATIDPTTSPYKGKSWRAYDGTPDGYLMRDYSDYPGAKQSSNPRDDQHLWVYHVRDHFYQSGNPWVGDWYEWMGEFMRAFSNQTENFPTYSRRGIGHKMNVALAAWSWTQDQTQFDELDSYIANYYAPFIGPPWEILNVVDEAPFEVGYMLRGIINIAHEAGPATNPWNTQIISNYCDWNDGAAWFKFRVDTSLTTPQSPASGASSMMIDPTVVFALSSGRTDLLVRCDQYVNGDLGEEPFTPYDLWNGGFGAAAYRHYKDA